MIFRVLVALLGCCQWVQSFGQFSYFNNLYFEPEYDAEAAGNIIQNGTEFGTIAAGLIDGQYQLITRFIDTTGIVLQETALPFDGFYPLLADACVPMETEGGYVYGMAFGDGAGIVRFNEALDTVWTSNFQASNAVGESYYQAKEYDGFIYAAGRIGVDENDNGGYVYDYNAILLTKSTLEGEVIDEYQYHVNVADFGCRANMFFPLGGNDFLFTTRQGNNGTAMSLNIVKANTETAETSVYNFSNPNLHSHLARAIQKADGRIIVCYGYTESYLFETDDYPDISVRLFEFDPETMLPVEEVISIPELNDYAIINDFMETPDGGYAICGETAVLEYTDVNDPNTLTGGEIYGFIAKLDSTFEHQWTELYQYSDPTPDAMVDWQWLQDIEVTDDEGFAAVGQWLENNSGPQRTWVVKTDCKGKLELPPLSFSAELTQQGDTILCTSIGEGVWDFQWNFGNGQVQMGDSATFVFSEPGTYMVTASSRYCAMTLDSTFVVEIFDCAGNISTPTLATNATYAQTEFTTEVQFSSSSENLENIEWNFGDSWISGNDQVFDFPDFGEYEVFVHGMYCDSIVSDTLLVVISDCQGNMDVPNLELGVMAEQVNDSTFSFTSSPENIENVIWYFGDESSAVGNYVVHTYLSSGSFDVLACGNYCDSLYCEEIEVSAVVGVDEFTFQGAELVIYPNPSLGSIDIQCTEILLAVRIRDLLGQEILVTLPNSKWCKIDLSTLANGTYFLEGILGNGRLVGEALIVNK